MEMIFRMAECTEEEKVTFEEKAQQKTGGKQLNAE